METEQYNQEELLPYPMLANTDKILETSEVIKDVAERKIYCHFLKTCSSSSLTSHQINRETSVELATIIGPLDSDEEPEEHQTDGKLSFPPDFKGGDPDQSPFHLPPESDRHYKLHRDHDGTTFPRHKLNSSTSSDMIEEMNSTFQINEVTHFEASSSKDQEDEDVFTELPMYESVMEGQHKKYTCQPKQDRVQHINNKDGFSDTGDRECYKKILKDHRLHLRTQSVKENKWYDSMLCLMNKLEQLNMDIEEALSPGSSPSATPYTKRCKQMVRECHLPFTVQDIFQNNEDLIKYN